MQAINLIVDVICAMSLDIKKRPNDGRFTWWTTFSMPLRRAPERLAGSEPPLKGLRALWALKKKAPRRWTLYLVDDLLNAIETRS